MKFHTPSSMINRQVSVSVIGIGGTGSYLLSMLSQINYLLRSLSDDAVSLMVTSYDPDTVSTVNCGRQNFYMMDVGKNKARALTERLNLGWGTKWRFVENEFPVNYANSDVIFTCVDNIALRMALGNKWVKKETETIWIDGGNDANQGNVILGHLGVPSAQLRLPNWYDLYADTMSDVKDDPTESCSHEQSIIKQDFGINHMSALLMSQYFWRLMRHGEIEHHIQMFDIAEGDLTSLNIDPQMWKTFNYDGDCSITH